MTPAELDAGWGWTGEDHNLGGWMGRTTKLLPIVKRLIATAQARFYDGSVGSEAGAFEVTVGDAVIFSAPAHRTLDGPIEIDPIPALSAPPADYFDTDAEEVVHVGNAEGGTVTGIRGVASDWAGR